MLKSEIFKALEDGKIIVHTEYPNIKYKLVEEKLYIYRDDQWKEDTGSLLITYSHYYEIEPERVIDLSKVKPEEIVHVNGEDVLGIIHMPNYCEGEWFAVVTNRTVNTYLKDGRCIPSSEESSFKFKDEDK